MKEIERVKDQIVKIENEKWVNRLLFTWLITTLLLVIGYFVQDILPSVLKKYDYIELLLRDKNTLFALCISAFISLVLIFVVIVGSEKTKDYANKVFERKGIIITTTIISMVICFLFVLIPIGTITSGVVNAKDVQTIDGKVEKVATASIETNGKVVKVITVIDSKGKEYKLTPSDRLESLGVSKNDRVVVDYCPTTSQGVSNEYKSTDGIVMGYKAHS